MNKVRVKAFLILLMVTSSIMAQNDLLNKKVNLNSNNVLIKEILKELRTQTGVMFSYKSSLISPTTRKTINVQNKPLAEVLHQLLDEEQLKFQLIGEQIILYKQATPKPEVTIPVKSTKEIARSRVYDTVRHVVYDTIVNYKNDTIIYTDTLIFLDTVKYVDTLWVKKERKANLKHSVSLLLANSFPLQSEITYEELNNSVMPDSLNNTVNLGLMPQLELKYSLQLHNFLISPGISLSLLQYSDNYYDRLTKVDSLGYYTYYATEETYTEVVGSYFSGGEYIEITKDKRRTVTDSLIEYQYDTTYHYSSVSEKKQIFYAGIPIDLQYNLALHSKWNILMGAGVSTHFLLTSNAERFSSWYVTYNVNTQFEYLISKKVYGFASLKYCGLISAASADIEMPDYFSVGIGIKITF